MSNTSDNALNVYVGQPGLQVSYNGGNLYISGSLVTVAAGTIAVTKNTTNYIYLLFSNNTVTANTSGFPSACFPMATVVVDNERPTTITDSRADFVTPVSDQGTFVSDVFESGTANPASAGVVRLAKTDAIKWRDNANAADIAISLNASDEIVLPNISLTGTVRWPAGTINADVVDFSNVVRGAGYKYIRMGTYDTPVPDNTTGLFHSYGLITSNGSIGFLQYHMMRGTGSSEIMGIEVDTENMSVGVSHPSKQVSGAFFASITSASATLATAADHTDGMFALRGKVYSADGSTSVAGSRVATIWLDAQLLGGNHSCDFFNIYSTGGGKQYKAWADFKLPAGETAGWLNLFSFEFDGTQAPFVAGAAAKAVDTVTQAFNLRIDINGTDYYIPVMAVA